jgi:hypothetical protein
MGMGSKTNAMQTRSARQPVGVAFFFRRPGAEGWKKAVNARHPG